MTDPSLAEQLEVLKGMVADYEGGHAVQWDDDDLRVMRAVLRTLEEDAPAREGDVERARSLVIRIRERYKAPGHEHVLELEEAAAEIAAALRAAREEALEEAVQILEGPWPATELYPGDVQFIRRYIGEKVRALADVTPKD